MALKQVFKDLRELRNVLPTMYCSSAGPVAVDLFHWQATVLGPSNSPYAGGVFEVSIQFPLSYPFNPPKVSFRTKVFHPQIDTDGTIRLDILKKDPKVGWIPATSVSEVLVSICKLLKDPNPDDPLVPEVAHLLTTDRPKFEDTARLWTQEHARG